MPPGTPYSSFALPYPIRVDAFGGADALPAPPALHLLTHTHSDHTTGLAAPSFASVIVCSPEAKEMLLRHEEYGARELLSSELRPERIRTYAHLRVGARTLPDGTLVSSGTRDLLVRDLQCLGASGGNLTYFIESTTIAYADARGARCGRMGHHHPPGRESLSRRRYVGLGALSRTSS